MDVAVRLLSVRGDAREGDGGSCTRDNAICRCTFLLFRVAMGRTGFRLRLIVEVSGELTTVVATFAGRLPGDGCKGPLEEGVVDDVALVVLAFDDPVAWVGFALA
jgi:hypothetical protein